MPGKVQHNHPTPSIAPPPIDKRTPTLKLPKVLYPSYKSDTHDLTQGGGEGEYEKCTTSKPNAAATNAPAVRYVP